MKKNCPPGIYPIRGVMGLCHLLVDENRKAILIDTGLIGEVTMLEILLKKLKLSPQDIEAILLTHGHIDHTGNLSIIQKWTGAPIFAHPAEQDYINGTYPYKGTACWCGRFEAISRNMINYKSTLINNHIKDGDILPFWGTLQVVHLPGHTEGHCGFYSPRHDLLFSGDLFASYFFSVHLPPPILNSLPEIIPASLARVNQMNPRLILPNHYDIADPILHKKRFLKLLKK